MITVQSNLSGQIVVVRRHSAALAIGAEIFSGIEAEGADLPQPAYSFALIFCKMGLCCIFNQMNIVFFGYFCQRIHIRRLSV